jgi:cadmium resistance protein CadD (predicted permease)
VLKLYKYNDYFTINASIYIKYFYNEYAKTIVITLLCAFSIIVGMLVFMQNEIYQQRVKIVLQLYSFFKMVKNILLFKLCLKFKHIK